MSVTSLDDLRSPGPFAPQAAGPCRVAGCRYSRAHTGLPAPEGRRRTDQPTDGGDQRGNGGADQAHESQNVEVSRGRTGRPPPGLSPSQNRTRGVKRVSAEATIQEEDFSSPNPLSPVVPQPARIGVEHRRPTAPVVVGIGVAAPRVSAHPHRLRRRRRPRRGDAGPFRPGSPTDVRALVDQRFEPGAVVLDERFELHAVEAGQARNRTEAPAGFPSPGNRLAVMREDVDVSVTSLDDLRSPGPFAPICRLSPSLEAVPMFHRRGRRCSVYAPPAAQQRPLDRSSGSGTAAQAAVIAETGWCG